MDTAPEICGVAAGRHIDTVEGPFLCKICSKAFTKRTSRNRHVLYCRKKLGDNLPTFRKSCGSCRKSKIKCDTGVPNCGRCNELGLGCVYELTKKSATSVQRPAFCPPDVPNSDGTLLVDFPEPGIENVVSWDAQTDNADEAQINLDVETSGLWRTPVPNMTLQNDLVPWEPEVGFVEDLEISGMNAHSPSDGFSINEFTMNWFVSSPTKGLAIDSTFSTPADCMFHTPHLVLRPMDADISLIAPRDPFKQAYLSDGSQIGRTFLLQHLKSYSTALAVKTLPPFIHSASLPSTDSSSSQSPTCSPPPSLPTLEICKSIVSLYVTKTAGTSTFVWRTVTMEKDRFMSEYLHADEWTVLSMLQSITLYILLRIFDEDPFSVAFDRELVRAMTMIAVHSEQTRLVCSAEIEGRRPDWKEWVLVESKRRTVTVLFILFLMFDIKPEQRAKSKVGLSVLPLPAQKNLWEAATEREWTEKYDEMLRARDGRGLPTYADLMALGRGHGGARTTDLNSWMVSADAFGYLILMAANTL